jgi:hypothetical protein
MVTTEVVEVETTEGIVVVTKAIAIIPKIRTTEPRRSHAPTHSSAVSYTQRMGAMMNTVRMR